jgi:hypothetical protein
MKTLSIIALTITAIVAPLFTQVINPIIQKLLSALGG